MDRQDDDRYFSLEELVRYSGLSRTTLHRLMREPVPMPVQHVGRRLLIRKGAFDEWLVARETRTRTTGVVHTRDVDPDRRVALALRGYTIADD